MHIEFVLLVLSTLFFASILAGKAGHWYGVEFERKLSYLIERLGV